MAGTRHTLRQDRFLWFIRLLQFIIMLCALGVAGNAAHVWTVDEGCHVPTRVAWNVACACLTLFFLLYLIPTTGPLSLSKFWNPWAQIGFDALFVIFWIAAAATSQATCTDLCNACAAWDEVYTVFHVWSGDVSCYCPLGYGKSKRGLDSMLMSRAGPPSTATSVTKTAESAGQIIAKQGFAGGLVFLFIVTLLYGLWKLHEDHTAAKTQNPETEELKNGPTVSETAV